MMFSVIVPLYNKVGYVKTAIQSIIDQTYSNFEATIVDDGSTDGSAELVEELIIGCNNFKLIHQSNAGVAAARNRGVAESKGDFLCFLDADDWWEPSFLEEMALFVKEYPVAGLYASNYIYYKTGKTRVAVDSPTGYINYPKLYFENGAMPVWTGAVCLPRRSFDKFGGFPVGIKLGEDFLLWSKIAVENKVAFLNKPLAYYNNDIPSNLRATRNLHNPDCHMLFNMGWLEDRVSCMEDNTDWKKLLDKLRVNGLMEYWLSKEYHQKAAAELQKVDWSRQPKSVIRDYKMPLCIMNAKWRFMRIGAVGKGYLIKLVKR